MPRWNLSKPFSIGGFVLAEIYMLFACLAPPPKNPGAALPMQVAIEPSSIPPGSPPPPGAVATKIAVSSIFFGPFGALVGLGVGLLVGGLLNRLLPEPAHAPLSPSTPQSTASPPADSAPGKT